MNGNVDALVFAGGIGEKAALLRTRIVEKCKCLGFDIDEQTNNDTKGGIVRSIGLEGSKYQVLVCQTDEQVRNIPSGCRYGSPESRVVRDGPAMRWRSVSEVTRPKAHSCFLICFFAYNILGCDGYKLHRYYVVEIVPIQIHLHYRIA